MMSSQVPNEGFLLNPQKRNKIVTKDIKPELFWPMYETIKRITQAKSMNPAWGPKKILKMFQDLGANMICTERQAKQYISLYFYDERTEDVYFKSADLSIGHRICIDRDRLVFEANKDHKKDHRGPDTVSY